MMRITGVSLLKRGEIWNSYAFQQTVCTANCHQSSGNIQIYYLILLTELYSLLTISSLHKTQYFRKENTNPAFTAVNSPKFHISDLSQLEQKAEKRKLFWTTTTKVLFYEQLNFLLEVANLMWFPHRDSGSWSVISYIPQLPTAGSRPGCCRASCFSFTSLTSVTPPARISIQAQKSEP